MPYKARKNKDGTYSVKSPSDTKARRITKAKAKAQQRLLYAVKEDEDFLEKRKRRNKVR